MSTIKSNLDHYRPKFAATSTPLTAPTNAQPKKSKFKPAKSFDTDSVGGPSARRPVTGLPSFSTPNFGRSANLAPLPAPTTPLAIREIIDVTSDESMSIESSGPLKRTSSDHSFCDPSASSSKRFRKDGPSHAALEGKVVNKENLRSVVANAKSHERRHQRPPGHDTHFRPTSSAATDVSPYRNRAVRTAESTMTGPVAEASASNDKQNTVHLSDIDLQSKTAKDLKVLLMFNQARAFETDQSIRKIEQGDDDLADIVSLRAIKQVLAKRMAAIQAAIDRLSGRISPSVLKLFSSDVPSTTALADRSPSAPSSDSSFSDVRHSTNLSIPPSAASRPYGTLASALIDFEDDGDEAMWDEVGDLPMHDIQEENRSRAASRLALPMPPVVERPAYRSFSDSNIVPIYDREPIKDSPYMEEIMEKLVSVFDMKKFRKNQLEAITATLSGRDVLVLMPTGGGKSLCYQLPAICQTGKTRGVTVVLSPLLALMRDQEQSLLSKGIDVVNLSSDQSDEANSDAWKKVSSRKKPSIMYVTPEKLESSGRLRNALANLYEEGELARFVVDEAHVISSWGKSFRTAYASLGSLRRSYPDVPIMALTATANQKTRLDIMGKLGIRECEVLLQSFNRPNLHYSVRPKSRDVVHDIATYIKSRHARETGIIYCLSRNKCEEVAMELKEKYGLRARHYHAALDKADRQRVQKAWQDGEFEIIVATIAFGMGIDKRDVRFVIHQTMSRSLDCYAQETGRAGRDGLPSDCVLFYSGQDVALIQQQIRNEDSLPREVAQLQIHELWQMADFCQNDVDCRRQELMAFFDQVFDPKDCHSSCDNCVQVKELKRENFTQQAQEVVRLLQLMLEQEKRVTQTLCIAVYRGSKIADVTKRGFDQLPLFGAGKALPANLIHRLFSHLYFKGVFIQEAVTIATWTNYYMQLGEKALVFLQSGEEVIMSVAVDTSASSSGKRKQLKKKAPRKARLPSTEDTFFVDAPDQDDPIQNDDPPERPIDDDVEFIEQPPAQAAPPLPPRHPARSTASKTSKPLANEASLVDPLERCYRDLRDIRLKIALKEGIESQDDVLSDECLQMLCCTSIRDLGDFRRVLSDAYTAEIAEEKHQRYEQHFLDICIRKSLELEEPSKARGGAIANTKSFDATEMQTRYAYSKPFSRRKAF